MSDKIFCKQCGKKYVTKNGLIKHQKTGHSFFSKYGKIVSVPLLAFCFAIITFFIINKPELLVEIKNAGNFHWNNLEYNFNIRNYGKSTAKDVEVQLDLDYLKGQFNRTKELPAGETFKASFNATLGRFGLERIQKILSEEKSAIGTLTVKYNWLFVPFSAEYYVVLNKDTVIVYQKK